MTSFDDLRAVLRLPVIASPMFLVSTPQLVIQQCLSGVVGSFPVLNARPQNSLADWLTQIQRALDKARGEGNPHVAPFAANIVIRQTNERLQADLQTCVAHRVPIVITSLGAPHGIVNRIHAYGGLVLHDVTTVRHARSALKAGVDGLILVCAGAGGHGGALSPFALLNEVRTFFEGPVILAGAIATGQSILAAQVMGADMVYMGTRFIATQEAGAQSEYKELLVSSAAEDILYTPYFSGTPANYLRESIRRSGLDPAQLNLDGARADPGERHLRWKTVWGAGQGVGMVVDLPSTADLVDRLEIEYRASRVIWQQRLAG